MRCWEVFKLSGYARVDFRVDKYGKPWVLEANPNPYLFTDAGFITASAKAGYSYEDTIRLIVEDALRRNNLDIPSVNKQ